VPQVRIRSLQATDDPVLNGVALLISAGAPNRIGNQYPAEEILAVRCFAARDAPAAADIVRSGGDARMRGQPRAPARPSSPYAGNKPEQPAM
jgi:hypothetical protein